MFTHEGTPMAAVSKISNCRYNCDGLLFCCSFIYSIHPWHETRIRIKQRGVRHTDFYVLQNLSLVQVVEEHVEIDIAVVRQRTNETHLELIDSYKNATLSVYKV